ncbi:MAG: nitrilase-related carbon-nitrogen hydrolase, partial [Candidatus Bathyarchaeia archaeon]
NQVGKNPQQEGFPACGQSLIIGPWGEILAEASSQQEGICFATLSKKEIQRIRRRIPHLPRHFEKHLELKRFSF